MTLDPHDLMGHLPELRALPARLAHSSYSRGVMTGTIMQTLCVGSTSRHSLTQCRRLRLSSGANDAKASGASLTFSPLPICRSLSTAHVRAVHGSRPA